MSHYIYILPAYFLIVSLWAIGRRRVYLRYLERLETFDWRKLYALTRAEPRPVGSYLLIYLGIPLMLLFGGWIIEGADIVMRLGGFTTTICAYFFLDNLLEFIRLHRLLNRLNKRRMNEVDRDPSE